MFKLVKYRFTLKVNYQNYYKTAVNSAILHSVLNCFYETSLSRTHSAAKSPSRAPPTALTTLSLQRGVVDQGWRRYGVKPPNWTASTWTRSKRAGAPKPCHNLRDLRQVDLPAFKQHLLKILGYLADNCMGRHVGTKVGILRPPSEHLRTYQTYVNSERWYLISWINVFNMSSTGIRSTNIY